MGQLLRRGRIWWIRYDLNGRRYEESSGSAKKGKAIDPLFLEHSNAGHASQDALRL